MNVLSAILLIPACAIGAGLLSFPVLTGLSGFVPSSLAIILCWLFATATGLIILDLTYASKEIEGKEDMHFFSISNLFLSPGLKMLAIGIFLFMCYGSLIGYCDALAPTVKSLFPISMNDRAIGIMGLAIFFALLHLGTKTLCIINNLFTPLMLAAYCLLIFLGMQSYDLQNLVNTMDFSKVYVSVPIIVTSFSFQFMIPTVVNILKTSKQTAQKCIIIGTSINCLIYLSWNFTMLGCIPIQALMTAYHESAPITSVLKGTYLATVGNIFACITLFTSFVSISLSVMDYWKDHLKTTNKTALSTLTFLPVLVIFLTLDKLFLWMFSITGGYGDSVLFGMLPLYMIKQAKLKAPNITINPVVFGLIALFACTVFGIQLHLDFGSFFK